MMDFPRSFGFADNPDYDVPQLRGRHQDRGWSCFDEDAECEFYHTWLVGYLTGIAERPIPDCQLKLCAKMEELGAASGADWLGHGAFYHLLDYEELVGYLRCGISYSVAAKKRRSLWEARVLVQGIGRTGPFAELTPSHWDEAKRELQEQEAFSGSGQSIDVGYRMPLARALARVKRTDEKFQLISRFINSFDEAESDMKGERLFLSPLKPPGEINHREDGTRGKCSQLG